MALHEAGWVNRALTAALLASFLALAPHVSAQANAVDPQRVIALFKEGKTLFKEGKINEACRKFEDAKALDPSAINLLLQLADCYEHLGRTATAWQQFRDAAFIAENNGDPRADFARKQADALVPKLSHLTIRVASVARGAEITRDGVRVPPEKLGKEIAVDPGGSEIKATAPGKQTWRVQREVAPGATIVVDVPALDPVKEGSDPLVASSEGRRTRHILAITAGAAGLAGLAAGGVLGAIAMHKRDASNAGGHCDAQSYCDDQGYTLRADAQLAGTISTVAFALGAVAAATGVVLWITAPATPVAPGASASGGAAPGPNPGPRFAVRAAGGPGGSFVSVGGVF